MTGDRPDEGPEGIEERLRSSLRAYADLVDDPATDLPARPAASLRRPAVRRWRGAVLAAAAAAAVVTGSVWFGTGDRPDPVAGAASGADRSSAAAGLPESDSMAAEAPDGPVDSAATPLAAAVGTSYPVDLLTHCGILGLDIGGVWFAAEPPLVEGGGNPPSGWGDPYQRGTVTLSSADAGQFTDDVGHVVRLRADESARPAPCD